MCLAVVALDAHPRYSIVVAANRDEYHARPTHPAEVWPDGLIAGRDLQAGGTWLGASRNGRFALLTNIRDPARHDPAAPSRGALVPMVLRDPRPPLEALDEARRAGSRHNGFNLIAGDAGQAGWTSNRSSETRRLAPGVHGLSNATLDANWPKVTRTRRAVERWAADGDERIGALFETLADRTLAADAELPATGVSLEWERMLSAAFILSERYGTRSSTVLTLDRGGEAVFVERSFDAQGRMTGEKSHRFRID